MAHIEQTKKASRKSGGPQYYLQDIGPATRAILDQRKNVAVRLWTPYGMVETGLTAVSSKVGRVGHDRVQSGGRVPSVADQIAHWYGLRKDAMERIEFDEGFDQDGELVISPTVIKFFGKARKQTIPKDLHPLTIVSGHHSTVITEHWRKHIRASVECRTWIHNQVKRIVDQHFADSGELDERDLLRAAGALHKLGLDLGVYRRTGLDCPNATFTFDGFPAYPCPVEVEEASSGFKAPHHVRAKHHQKRVVLLCLKHDAPDLLRNYVDIIELIELERLLREAA